MRMYVGYTYTKFSYLCLIIFVCWEKRFFGNTYYSLAIFYSCFFPFLLYSPPFCSSKEIFFIFMSPETAYTH